MAKNIPLLLLLRCINRALSDSTAPVPVLRRWWGGDGVNDGLDLLPGQNAGDHSHVLPVIGGGGQSVQIREDIEDLAVVIILLYGRVVLFKGAGVALRLRKVIDHNGIGPVLPKVGHVRGYAVVQFGNFQISGGKAVGVAMWGTDRPSRWLGGRSDTGRHPPDQTGSHWSRKY